MSEDEEEDWFERAMREEESESKATAEELLEESPEPTADDEPESVAEAEEELFDDGDEELSGETEEELFDDDDGDEDGDNSDSSEPETKETSDGNVEETEDAFSGDADEDDTFGGVAPDQEDAFGDAADESDAFGGVAADQEDAFGGDAATSGFEPSGDGQPFGDGQEFGGEGDPFASGSEGGAMEFGGGGDTGPEFDEEDLDSDIDRIDVGIDGLDEMILGGVPRRSLMVTIGSAGTGKTTFGLQFLTEGLENDEKAVYVTLEESREAILSTAEEKGWPFREWRDEGKLAVVAMDPIEMANSLASIRSDISRLVKDYDADRLVLDSVSLLEMMYDHPAKRRSEVFDFARSLKYAGVTTMLTSEASSDNAYTSRYGIIEYLVDAVFILQYVRPSDFRETRLAVEIQKIRDANHSRETKPYEITNDGISVYRQANIF